MRTVKDPEVRKQEILEGAIRFFTQKGYDKTTITDIAKELNISQGLCYRYFSSKEEIYDAAIDEYAGYIVNEYLKNRQTDRSIHYWIDSIADSLRNLTEAEKDQPDFYKLFHSSQNKKMHNELFLRVVEKLIPHITDILKKAKQKGEIKIDDCEGIATFGLYGEIGMFFAEGLSIEERIDKIKKAWYKLLDL